MILFDKSMILISCFNNAECVNPAFGRRVRGGSIMPHPNHKLQEDHAGLRSHDQQVRHRQSTPLQSCQPRRTLHDPHHPRPPRPLRSTAIFFSQLFLPQEGLHDQTHQRYLPLSGQRYRQSAERSSTIQCTRDPG